MQTRFVCLLSVLCLGLPLSVLAQAPAAPVGAPPAAGARPANKPQNLKVLPEDADLRTIMRGFADALGVECEFCHAAADPVTHRSDRASDANPMKDTARAMIRMTGDLNTKYLATLPNVQEKATVSCGTCHRGEKEPSAFVPPPRQPGNGPGGPPPGGMPAPMAPGAPPPGN